ncbi:MAG TPA: FAD-binding oxidoreductase [Gemmatimonadaceae bacterium]
MWETRSIAGPAYPVLRGEHRADVCVVGLGGSGLSCIDRLLCEPVSVIGIDAGTVGGAAAGRNGGLLRAGTSLFYHKAAAAYGFDRAARMYSATIVERERLVRGFPDIARRIGYLRLAHDTADTADCREHLDVLRQAPFPAQWYDGSSGSGVLVPDDAVIDPLARCRLEAGRAAASGARLFERSRAIRIDDGIVETTEGSVRCRLTIVAVDGGLAAVLPELEGRVWPMRLQMFASGPHEAGLLPHAISARGGWEYAQQLPDGTIAFGGCRDAGGDAERTTDTSVTAIVQDALEARFREVIGVDPMVTHRWAATAGYTTDGLPVVEEVRPGVWAVGGYCGTGNLFGAACGRSAARRALGIDPDTLLD